MLFMERKAPDLDLKKTDLGGQKIHRIIKILGNKIKQVFVFLEPFTQKMEHIIWNQTTTRSCFKNLIFHFIF